MTREISIKRVTNFSHVFDPVNEFNRIEILLKIYRSKCKNNIVYFAGSEKLFTLSVDEVTAEIFDFDF